VTPRHHAEARHRAYSLLARLFTKGLCAQTRAIVAALPELNDAVGSEDEEEWAAQHYAAVCHEVFPYESVFVGDGQLGGEVASAVRAVHERCGLNPTEEPDHIGAELALLAHLCAAERDAHADDAADEVARLQQLQRQFLSQHLLRWLPTLVVALVRSDDGLYAAAARLTAELVGDHASELGATVEAADAESGLAGVLDNPKTGIKRLCGVLLNPTATGLFWGQRMLGELAADAGVPEGFGTRKRKLESIVFAAVDHDRVVPLMERIVAEVGTWQAHYDELAVLGLPTQLWRGRLVQGRELVQGVLLAVDDVEVSSPQ